MSNISARLDRLPITSLHRIALAALAFGFFFELGDLNSFAFAAPAIIRVWHIPVRDVALITSASFGGMFLGGVGGGRFADRIGRKRGFIGAVLVYAVFSLLNALSWNVATLAIFRFLTGVGLGGMTVIANTYVSEVFPAAKRGRYLGFAVTVGLIGIPATAWVARFVVPLADWGWRLVFVWGALGVFAIPIAARMAESPRWLQRRGEQERAEAETRRLEVVAEAEHGRLPAPTEAPDAELLPAASLRHLLTPRQFGRTFMLVVVWIFQTWGFNGFVSWAPTLLVEHGISLIHTLEYASLIAVCNPLGALIAANLVDRVERRWFIVVNALVIAVCGVLYGATFDPPLIVVFGGLVVMASQAMAVALYTYTPELFPTDVRSSGMGLTYGVGRLANVVGPLIIGAIFVSSGYLSVFLFTSVCWLFVAATIAIFGISTTGRPLEALTTERKEAMTMNGRKP